ncbi:MAG: class IV adenylate cyclase [Ferruginibacter sp.]
MPVNFEFKARTNNIDVLEKKLLTLNPVYKGEDRQVDTYFNIETGRLKLREGNIENALIYYDRKDDPRSKQSNVLLYETTGGNRLKEILIQVHGIKKIIAKSRKIYFIENVKFHFDIVEGIGSFVEVEAIDDSDAADIQKIKEQCNYYASFFGIKEEDYVSVSYSDM